LKKEEYVTVLQVNTDGLPQKKVIKNELETFQKIVGGYIEVVDFGGVLAIIHDEGKLINLPPNFAFTIEVGNETYFDIIMGNVIFIADFEGEDGKEFRSLTFEEMDVALSIYAQGKKMLFDYLDKN
jgi:hypothetical protein